MADENNKLFDADVPAPAPITLTFGDEGSPEIQEETPAADVPADSADSAVAAAAAAVQEAKNVLAEETPVSGATGNAAADAAAAVAPDISLTPEEQAQVDAFAEKIDIHDSNAIMQYGAGTQKKMSDFSDLALENVKNKDMGEVGKLITGLVTELKSFDVEEEDKGFFKFFKKQGNKLVALKAKYDKTEASIDDIVQVLEGHQVQLLKDVATLDKMYDLNLQYFKELSMYIAAGKKRLAEVRANELKELQEKAAQTGDAQDAQKAKDFGALCDRFEKKLHDLELTRQIAIQTGPQIRLVQDSDTLMAEKIQSTIVNTIPLWKNQMVIAIGIEHANQAAKAEREVNDMTNALLRKNAEKLKQATVETAKEAERGIVDIETLKHTNEMLISTMDEVMAIQAEGKQKRAAAEKDLAQIEQQLREKLLQASRS